MRASKKAIRLLAAAKVMPAGAAAVFRVEGDHGIYNVVIGDGFAFCDCPARGFVACTHIEAATHLHAALVDAPPDRAAEALERIASAA